MGRSLSVALLEFHVRLCHYGLPACSLATLLIAVLQRHGSENLPPAASIRKQGTRNSESAALAACALLVVRGSGPPASAAHWCMHCKEIQTDKHILRTLEKLRIAQSRS